MDIRFDTPPQSKAELIQRIHAARAALDSLIAPLSPDALAQPGPDGGWAVQDHLFHLAEWRWKLLAMIQGRPGYEGLRLDAQTFQTAGLDGINAILLDRSRQHTTAEILADYHQARQAILQALEALDEADLQRAYDLTDPSDTRLLLEGIINNTYGHDLEHLNWIKELLETR